VATSTLTAAMPALELAGGARLVLEAIDAATGAAVAGVVVNDFVIYAGEGDGGALVENPTRTLYLSQSDSDLGRNPADFGGPA
jgi:hypothetical protein